ncbi:MAG: allantoinase AllB [Candidatus Bathyarchaeia archaeon]
MDLVVRNGIVYTPYGLVNASIGVEDGKIAWMGRGAPEGGRILDVDGKLVLPGMIDMHVHFRDPGSPEREDFETGTMSAAAGGVTTVVEMPNTAPPVTSAERLREKRRIVEGKAYVDFALVAGAGSMSREEIKPLAAEGAIAYKMFMISRFKELAVSDADMLENLLLIAETGLPCLVHAENEELVSRGIERARNLGRRDPLAHSEFRPPLAEAEATMRAILLAEEASAHLHICHMTSSEALGFLSWAKGRGVKVTGETSPCYLLLSTDDLKRLGPYGKVDPPLREPEHQRALWQALGSGLLDVVASDHAPYTREEKERGWSDIFDAPSGGVGVETTLPLMLDSVNKGLLSLERMVEVLSTNPARILGLYPRKGCISIGSDADLVVVDPKAEFEIRGRALHPRQKITQFEGYRGRGKPILTIVRGKTVWEEGKIVGRPGYGRFLTPTYKEEMF